MKSEPGVLTTVLILGLSKSEFTTGDIHQGNPIARRHPHSIICEPSNDRQHGDRRYNSSTRLRGVGRQSETARQFTITQELRLESAIQFERHRRGAKNVVLALDGPIVRGKLPRVARLMALAIHFDRLIRNGQIKDYTELAELAELGHVPRARVTQIMNLTNLAPEIQEEIHFLPRVESGRDVLHLRQLQQTAGWVCWKRQRRAWRELISPEN